MSLKTELAYFFMRLTAHHRIPRLPMRYHLPDSQRDSGLGVRTMIGLSAARSSRDARRRLVGGQDPLKTARREKKIHHHNRWRYFWKRARDVWNGR